MKVIEKFENRTMPIKSYEMKGLKWNELFESENDLISSLIKMNDDITRKNYLGYEYLISFKKALNNDRELSPKQLTQLKRLACEVYRYHWNDKNTSSHKFTLL